MHMTQVPPIDRPLMTPVPGTNLYRLEAPLVVRLQDRDVFRVRAGFESDGASIPRWLWWLIGHPFTPSFSRAAWVHDMHYRTQQVTREFADEILHTLLRHDGVSRLRAGLMYRAVRWFGWWPWRRRAWATPGR